MMPRRRRATLSFRLAEVLTGVAITIFAACNDLYLAEINNTIISELEQFDLTDTCGPGLFEALIPDCPLEGVCYTDACAAHDLCYTTCGTDRGECDDQFRTTLESICDTVFPLGDPNHADCRYTALTYWLSVSLLGQNPFDIAQSIVCEDNPPPPIEPRGACCAYADRPVCTDDVLRVDCGPSGVFVSNLTCNEIGTVFGGCPVPDNDSCADRVAVCDGFVANPGLGQCAGDALPDRGGGVCDLTAQDCPNGGPCLPVDGNVFRCTIPTDNRLATTDGPTLVGGCGPAEPDSLQADVWYSVTAPCDASLSVRMCGADNYDAMLAVYRNDVDASCSCPTADDQPAACNDDFCFTFGSTSGVDLEVTQGQCIVLRVGGWASEADAASAARGQSELDIGFFCTVPAKVEPARLPHR